MMETQVPEQKYINDSETAVKLDNSAPEIQVEQAPAELNYQAQRVSRRIWHD